MVSKESNGVLSFKAGDVIAEEGSPAGGVYILLSGRVGVEKQSVPVAQFTTRGMVFGEISSILSRPRTARLVALDDTVVTYFNANLDELIAQHPKVAKTIMVSLAQRLERTTDAWWVALQVSQSAANGEPAAGGAAASPTSP